ncbi:MAG TPA: hypothetical protein DCE08_07265 [Ruminococcaceae bacterium]|nr:hypothetical protein [Oscillospiraceae bacterium]
MKIVSKILAVVLCLCLALSFASCGEDTTWVIKNDQNTVSAGQYLYYLMNAYATASGKVSDSSKDVLSQQVEEKDASEWIKESAMESARMYLEIEKMFAEEGLTLDDADTAYIDQYVVYMWVYYSEIYEKNGISDKTLREVMLNSTKSGKLFDHLYGEGGAREIPVEDVKKYINENYAKTKSIVLSLNNLDGKLRDEATIAEIKALAEKYQTQLNDEGADIERLLVDYDRFEKALEEKEKAAQESSDTSSDTASNVSTNEEANDTAAPTSSTAGEETSSETSDVTENPTDDSSTAASSEDTSSDSASSETTEDENLEIISKSSTKYTDAEKEAVFALENGKAAVVVEDEYIRVVLRMDIFEDDTYLKEYDSTARAQIKGDEFTEELKTKAAELTVEVNEKAVKRYKPSKIKLK